jgi:hypothetical protein
VDSGSRRRVSSPGWVQPKEGQAGNLTLVSYSRLDGERRPAAKRSKRQHWSSVLGDKGHREVEKMVAQGAVSRCCPGGAFYGVMMAS